MPAPGGWFSAYWFFVRPSELHHTGACVPEQQLQRGVRQGRGVRERCAGRWPRLSPRKARRRGRRDGRHARRRQRTCASALFASALFGSLVHATTNAPLALAYGRSVTSSCVSPDPESITSTSPLRTTPMSPCSASTALRKMERVPVLASVWHTFLATNEVLPTPVNRVVPLQSMIFCRHAATSSRQLDGARGATSRDGESMRTSRAGRTGIARVPRRRSSPDVPSAPRTKP